MRTLLLPAVALSALAVSACGSSGSKTPSGAVLDRNALARDLTTRLSDTTPGPSPKVTCPSDLPVKKDISERCTATLAGKRYGVTVTVTGTSGGSAAYDVAVDRTPQQ